MFDFSQIDSDVTVWMVIDNEEYEVSRFKIDFVQSSDYKGQPQDETRGGRIIFTNGE